MQTVLVALGALATLAGALSLVLAFRRGQSGDHEGERRLFRAAVAGLAVGSLVFLVSVVLFETR